MTEPVPIPCGGSVPVPVINPWAYCTACGSDVDARCAGQNRPCGCRAEIGSVCPSWEPFHGCRCSDPGPDEVEAAVALQEALEEHERKIRAGVPTPVRRIEVDLPEELDLYRVSFPGGVVGDPDKVRLTRIPPAPDPGDEVFAQVPRFRAILSWAVVMAAILVIAGGFSLRWPW